jgi:hypothetical protein
MAGVASFLLHPDSWGHRLGDVPHGARRNGLDGDAYVPLLDLAPTLTDGLLLALRRAGIAAYAAPTPRRRPGGRPTTDRVWVEVWGRGRAEDVVRAELSRRQW